MRHIEGARVDDEVLTALKAVIDPELGLNVVDLGLVQRVERRADAIHVALMMTTPACPLGEMLVADAERALAGHFPDVTSIHVELLRDAVWSPQRMTEDGRRQLGLTR